MSRSSQFEHFSTPADPFIMRPTTRVSDHAAVCYHVILNHLVWRAHSCARNGRLLSNLIA